MGCLLQLLHLASSFSTGKLRWPSGAQPLLAQQTGHRWLLRLKGRNRRLRQGAVIFPGAPGGAVVLGAGQGLGAHWGHRL